MSSELPSLSAITQPAGAERHVVGPARRVWSFVRRTAPEWLTLLGLGICLALLFRYAHFQDSVLDEGAYTYKGWLFASGQYTPYQPYGPWTNHMPLAFLSWGAFQQLFGPGLRTARYAAVFLAMLLLLGMVILARRSGGRWWGAALPWIFALNPAILRMYSVAVSQILVAFLLVWTLVLVLPGREPGKNRPRALWMLVAGGILSGIMLLTRINMLVVPPLVILYVFWQYGVKAGFWAGIACLLTVLIGHALYWPDILQLWAMRLPRDLTPFLDAWRLPRGVDGIWQPNNPFDERLVSLFHVFRFHFAAAVGALTAWLLWPRRRDWDNPTLFRESVFLSAMFLLLLLMHMQAALGEDYCVFCLAGYVTFFSPAGLLLALVSYSYWRRQLPAWRQALILLTILGISAGIGYGSFEDIGAQLADLEIPAWLVASRAPGSVPLGAVLTNMFGVNNQALRRSLPVAAGLLAGATIIAAAWVIKILTQRRAPQLPRASLGYWAMTTFLVSGSLLAFTQPLGGGYATYDCSSDAIASHEATGQALAAVIPPGSVVYWRGPLSAAPLLYLPNLRIFPAQINDGYSFITTDVDPALLERLGRWSRPLAAQWLQESDYVLVEERSYNGWILQELQPHLFEELPSTPPTVLCRPDSVIRIFHRLNGNSP